MQSTLRAIPTGTNPAQCNPIGDGVIALAKSEAGLLGLMRVEFEAEYPEQSFKKKIAGALAVSERHVGEMLYGKANATPRQLHAIARACGSMLFERWLQIHFMGENNGSDQVSAHCG